MSAPSHQVWLPVGHGIALTELRRADRTSLADRLNDREIYDRLLLVPYPYSLADADRFLDIAEEATAKQGEPIHFAIRDRQGELIGGLGFQSLTLGHSTEIGYWLGRPFWGQGIMTDVVRVAVEHAFTRWNVVRIAAHVHDFNQASARVLEKNGFQCEGLLRKRVRKNGQFLDSRLYALVR